ncbi:nucleotidyltransferase substrate binding protein [uncultured Dysosmobacter sp.]|uniref:nucleotidyltransferase substrate binding protein n=1 Tax=uncultured Dysosmobacter sp. TaxID=2591384 RepID=UPI00261A769C|nr:nucleotidyltransferase substrate binding protein [uncultured Dysosmobacter sp.]
MLQKMENYKHALAQLEEAVERYQKTPEDALYRDGLIQRFEFTVELAWKSIKEYLEDQGMVLSIASPRGILKEAFSAGVLDDAQQWNDILTARNLTSHVYDEATAVGIARKICTEFLSPLRALLRVYEQ